MLSFVIPAHNEELYIDACLRAILKSIGEKKGIEIIVVDNASTDRTKDVVKKYPQVKLIDEPKKGTNQARQTGLSAASGELVAHIDADSLPTREWLERVLKEFEKNPRLVCISGPYIYYDLPSSVNVLVKIFYSFLYLFHLTTNLIANRTTFLIGGNFVVRKAAVIKMGGYNTEITFYGDDADIAKRLSSLGKIKFILKLRVLSSGRRLATEGITTTTLRYVFNYFWITLFNKPFTRTSVATRPAPKNDRLKFLAKTKRKDFLIAFFLFFGLLLLITLIIYFTHRNAFSVLGF